MKPSLNDIRIHGCLVLHVIPKLPTRSSVFIDTTTWNQTLLMAWVKEAYFLRLVLRNLLYSVWILLCIVYGRFTSLHVYFLEELLYIIWCKFGSVSNCCQTEADCKERIGISFFHRAFFTHCLLLEPTNALLHFTTYSVFAIKLCKTFKIFMLMQEQQVNDPNPLYRLVQTPQTFQPV
jgi:hypothetical protein